MLSNEFVNNSDLVYFYLNYEYVGIIIYERNYSFIHQKILRLRTC